ncbi:MAG TPA: hypothetical protein VG347_20680 [Verrucomicrobiae bacterium]|nr:hypothetical protein [Verrucomicrobiae bacterium]
MTRPVFLRWESAQKHSSFQPLCLPLFQGDGTFPADEVAQKDFLCKRINDWEKLQAELEEKMEWVLAGKG